MEENEQEQEYQQLPNNGTYYARRSGKMTVQPAFESGAVAVAIPFTLLRSDVAYSGVHNAFIILKDGTPSENTLKNLKRIFPQWESADPFDLETIPIGEDLNAAEFVLADCVQREYADKKTGKLKMGFNVGFLNALEGGGRQVTAMSPDERKAFIAKNGAKLRALLGAVKTATPTKPTAAASTTKPASEGPPARRSKAGSPAVGGQARTCSEGEAWKAYKASRPDDNEDDVVDGFWSAAEELFPDNFEQGTQKNKLTAPQWGAVADKLGV